MILPLLNKIICNIFPFIIFLIVRFKSGSNRNFQTNEENDSAHVNASSVFLVVQEYSSPK